METQWLRYSNVYECSVGGGWRHSGSDIAMFMCVQKVGGGHMAV